MEDITEVTSDLYEEIVLRESDGSKKVIESDNLEKAVLVPNGRQLEKDSMEEEVEDLKEKLEEKEEKLEEMKDNRVEELSNEVVDIREEKGVLSEEKDEVLENLQKLSIEQLEALKKDAKSIEVDQEALSVSRPETDEEDVEEEEANEQLSEEDKKNKVRENIYGKNSKFIGD